MTPAFNSMVKAMNMVLNTFESIQKASGQAVDTASIQASREAIAEVSVAMQQLDTSAKIANESITQISNSNQRARNSAKGLNDETSKLPQNFLNANNSAHSLVQTLMGFSVVQRVVSLVTSNISSALNRLDTMNNYPKVMSNLSISGDKANASINLLSEKLDGLPTTLNDAASSVQNFTSANSNIERSTRMFLALNNAILAGGGSTQVQQSALEQLSQSYAKGKPDMVEWRSAMTAMPAQMKQVATAMGYINANALGEDLRAGKVSMDQFMDTFIQLNEKGLEGLQSFEQQARNATGGYATSIANMKSAVTRGIASMITSINNSLQSAGFGTIQEIIAKTGKGIETMLKNIGTGAGKVIEFLAPTVQFIIDNWSIIEPLIMGIATAILAYNLALGAHKLCVEASTIAQTIHAAALNMQAGATFTATAAQYGFNAALLACPLTWIIIGIIAIVAIIYAVVAAINKAKDTTISATGVIIGSLAVAGAFILNIVIGIINAIIRIIDTVANIIITAVEALLNVLVGGFNNFGDKVAYVIGNVASWFLDLGAIVTKIIDAIFGTNWTAGLNSLSDKVQQWGSQDNKITLERWDHSIDRINYGDAYQAGYDFGYRLVNKDAFGALGAGVQNTTNVIENNANSFSSFGDIGSMAFDTSNIADNTGKIKDSLEVTEEDLKYLMDIAERESINRFTTAEIKIDFSNTNHVQNDMDVD